MAAVLFLLSQQAIMIALGGRSLRDGQLMQIRTYRDETLGKLFIESVFTGMISGLQRMQQVDT